MPAHSTTESPPLSTLSLIFIASGVGALSGLSAVLLRYLINIIHGFFFFGHLEIASTSIIINAVPHFPLLTLIIPIIGALLVTYIIEKCAPEARGHGVPEAMYAIYYEQSKIRPIVAVVKAGASAISIGTGGSAGQEGPIIQIGAALGSMVGQWIQMPHQQRALLIAAGASAGLAATFNAPMTGLLFAVELMLLSITAISIGVVAIATVVATLTSYIFLGSQPTFNITQFIHFTQTLDDFFILLFLIPFGLFNGWVSSSFIKYIYVIEDCFKALFKNPYYRHMCGMALVGIILSLFMYAFGQYYIAGTSDHTIEAMLNFLIQNPGLLLLLFMGKFLATCLTLGSGGSGGIFTPCIFMGATLGAAYAVLLQLIFPELPLSPLIFVMCGIAAVVGSTTGAIMTAIVMSFEITRNEAAMLPIMLTALIAYITRQRLRSESIYTHKLREKGFALPKSLDAGFVTAKTASDIMQTCQSISLDQISSWQQDHSADYLIIYQNKQIQRALHLKTEKLSQTIPTIKSNQTFYWINAKAIWMEILKTIDVNEDIVILVKQEQATEDIQHIIGIITHREIVHAVKTQADLS